MTELSSQYYAKLDQDSQTRVEAMAEQEQRNLDLYLMDSTEFRKQFVGQISKDAEVFLSPLGNWEDEQGRKYEDINFTTAEHPQIIFDSGAIPCTLAVAFDEQGNVGISHATYYEGFQDGAGQPYEDAEHIINSLNTFSKDHLTGKKHLLLSGTNIGPRLRNPVTEAITTQMDAFEASEIQTLFTDEYPDDPPGSITFTESNISGVYVIPKALSENGKNKIFFVGDTDRTPTADIKWRNVDLLRLYKSRP